MARARAARTDVLSTEVIILSAVEGRGPQILEPLCSLPEVGSSQALPAVDRLSRFGAVAIELMPRGGYRVSFLGME